MKTLPLAIAAISAVALATSATQAHALDWGFKPYVGLDATHMTIDFKAQNGISGDQTYADSYNGLNPYLGADLNQYLAVELGYLQTASEGKSFDFGGGVSGHTSTKIKGFHLDAIGKYAVSPNVRLLGTVGVARLKEDVSGDVSGLTLRDSETSTAWRLGVGADYKIHDNWYARGMIRYMVPTDTDTVDNVMQYSLGVAYHF